MLKTNQIHSFALLGLEIHIWFGKMSFGYVSILKKYLKYISYTASFNIFLEEIGDCHMLGCKGDMHDCVSS